LSIGVADHPSWLEIISQQFETKFGGWQQPDEFDPCRVGLGGCPVQWTTGYELRKLTAEFSRTFASAPAQDAAMITMHYLNLTAGDPDATWTTTDYTTVETAFDTFWAALATYYPTSVALSEINWRADGPSYKPFGTNLQPTLRVVARSAAGSGTVSAMLPPQCAVSVTEVTPAKYTVLDVEGVGTQSRNRWGRFYLPAPLQSTVVNGRYSNTFSAAVSAAVETMYNTLIDADLLPVMYSPTTGAAWLISEVHVDDICDVIRSRRFVEPFFRQAHVLHTP
jgi:hypothetical protein